MKKIRWGILSTAKIGVEKVIPAMQQSLFSEVTAIASRDAVKASEVAARLNIPKSYGSYEELLLDKDIDAVYISLPNHLHVEWGIRSLQSGKHLLCEKPVGMNAQEAEELQRTSLQFPHLTAMEAFMYRFHPQWDIIRSIINNGEIGEVKALHSKFCYYNIDPLNIRNRHDAGGGGLMDIGCYCVSFSRFLFNDEPTRVLARMDIHPSWKTDTCTSGIMEFKNGTSTFTCSTQLTPCQHAEIIGTKGSIMIEFPFTPPFDRSTTIRVNTTSGSRLIECEPVNHYTLQADAFSSAILEKRASPNPLSDAVMNMKAIDGLKRSAKQNEWINL